MCDSTQVLESDILAGRWQKVLITIKSLKLPNDTLAKIYEQIILELLELNEKKGSKYFFELQFFQSHMRQHNKARLRVLESMLVRNYFDVKEAYPNNLTKEKSRAKIAKLIIQEINNVTSSRLLTLLGQSLKWQQHQGILPPGQVIDIFRGKTTVREQQEENIPLNLVVSME
ncbi:MAG: Serine/threonine-protein kinase smu1, partial [Paramarteilia canceri]